MADKAYYRKLVRDRLPEKIAAKGSECEVRELSEAEFAVELRKKAGEEASELLKCASHAEFVEELADLVAVVEELKRAESVTEEELHAALARNLEKKGGFEKRLFLEWSSDDGYKSNETTGT